MFYYYSDCQLTVLPFWYYHLYIIEYYSFAVNKIYNKSIAHCRVPILKNRTALVVIVEVINSKTRYMDSTFNPDVQTYPAIGGQMITEQPTLK